MSLPEKIELRPVGIVRSPVRTVTDDGWGGVIATTELDPQQFGSESILKLDQYSQVENFFSSARHPRGRRIESVDRLQFRVEELDAVDGTPVLDVKPYLKGFAPRGDVRKPAKSAERMAGYFRKP
jgi:tRNA (Thr-GGU) A37 N-methylase